MIKVQRLDLNPSETFVLVKTCTGHKYINRNVDLEYNKSLLIFRPTHQFLFVQKMQRSRVLLSGNREDWDDQQLGQTFETIFALLHKSAI